MKFSRILLTLAACALASCCSGTRGEEGDGTASSLAPATVDYDSYFTPERLRLDLILSGDRTTQSASLSCLYREPQWAGSPHSLIDRSGYGQYFLEAFSPDGTLLYSRGFSTLFEEWRTTAQADEVQMAATQTVWMPFPKDRIRVVIYQRVKATGLFEELFSCPVDPTDRHIIPVPRYSFDVTVLQKKGDLADKVDLVFAGEGYAAAELPKLRADAARMMEYLFSMEPYRSRRDDFNVTLVESVSEESGVDLPHRGVWTNSIFNTGFDTFYIDRYLTAWDHSRIADVFACAPFDAFFIIANSSTYGGGGFYNSYGLGTSDHRLSEQVFIHEFGHSFAGLGDEYYDSEVAYEDFYNLKTEPWEPNITTLVDFASKWEDMVEEDIAVPTPNDSAYMGHVGVFEGAGYMTYGCYRPYYECRMLNNTAPAFCPVCQRAIDRMIDYYIGVQR